MFKLLNVVRQRLIFQFHQLPNSVSCPIQPYMCLSLHVWTRPRPAINGLTFSVTKTCALHLALSVHRCPISPPSRRRPLSPIRPCPKGRKRERILLRATIFHNLLCEGLFTRGEAIGSIGNWIYAGLLRHSNFTSEKVIFGVSFVFRKV